MAKKLERNSLGMFASPYKEKRSQSTGIRFTPEVYRWLQEQKEIRKIPLNNIVLEAVEFYMKAGGGARGGQPAPPSH